jgi:hypothetical protein
LEEKGTASSPPIFLALSMASSKALFNSPMIPSSPFSPIYSKADLLIPLGA